MAFLSDVKSTRLALSGVIFGGRTRVKGIYIVPGAGVGSVTILDGGAGGTTVSIIDIAAGSSVYLHLPEDGLLCTTSSYATLAGITAATFFYA